MTNRNADAVDGPQETVDLCGLTLEVSSPRLARLLGEAVADDPDGNLDGDGDPSVLLEQVREALPDVLVSPPTRSAEDEERARQEVRDRASGAARALGFEVLSGGRWVSAFGDVVLARSLGACLTPAAAAHFVAQVVASGALDSCCSGLFVVNGDASVHAFVAAIRQRRLQGVLRVIGIDDLEALVAILDASPDPHRRALALLAPVFGVNAGELLPPR